MTLKKSAAIAAVAAIAWTGAVQGQATQGRGCGRGGVGGGLLTAIDASKDGNVTRDEAQGSFEKWYTEWDTTKSNALTQEQLAAGLQAALPPPAPAPGFTGAAGRGAAPQPQTPDPAHVQAMVAALPATAPAKPKQARKVLVLAKAAGFVHSSIPLAARTIEEMGKKYGTWTTTISYDPADINEANLKQYDAIFLDSTTGAFLDEPTDQAVTAARRKALLDFVRSGKGLAGIHAASDSYHQNRPDPNATAGRAGGGGGRGFGGGRGQAGPVVAQFIAQGDKNSDQKVSRAEFAGLADSWYTKMDTDNSGRIAQADFPQ